MWACKLRSNASVSKKLKLQKGFELKSLIHANRLNTGIKLSFYFSNVNGEDTNGLWLIFQEEHPTICRKIIERGYCRANRHRQKVWSPFSSQPPIVFPVGRSWNKHELVPKITLQCRLLGNCLTDKSLIENSWEYNTCLNLQSLDIFTSPPSRMRDHLLSASITNFGLVNLVKKKKGAVYYKNDELLLSQATIYTWIKRSRSNWHCCLYNRGGCRCNRRWGPLSYNEIILYLAEKHLLWMKVLPAISLWDEPVERLLALTLPLLGWERTVGCIHGFLSQHLSSKYPCLPQ